jgi:hypothetical protein
MPPLVKLELHWRPARERIEFKFRMLAYGCPNGTASANLIRHVQRVSGLDSQRRFRFAAEAALLALPTQSAIFGDRSFSCS